MKKKIQGFACTIVLFALLIFPGSCLKDHLTYTYTIREPIYKTLSQVRAEVKVSPKEPLQSPGKIYIKGDYIFLNETDKGIHVIDNTDASNPQNMAFINIPGNQDLAIKDNILYADCYSDLLAIDITDVHHIVVKKTIESVFLNRIGYFMASSNPDSIFIITGWTTKDTTINYEGARNYPVYPIAYNGCAACATALNAPASSSSTGIGGSMARFTIVNNWLYAVDNTNLDMINITESVNPQFVGTQLVDWHIETIYPFRDKLFIGSNNGVFMYDISHTPEAPQPAGQFTHVRACDPVIADEHYAYVTLSDGTPCLGFDNELQIVNINNLDSASLVSTYPMKHPLGLSKDGPLLFLCDDMEGLKLFNVDDPVNLKLLGHFTDCTPKDVITVQGLALVLAKEGLFEYDYSNPQNIVLKGKLTLASQ
jgi:hypothetical protein